MFCPSRDQVTLPGTGVGDGEADADADAVADAAGDGDADVLADGEGSGVACDSAAIGTAATITVSDASADHTSDFIVQKR